MPPKGAFLERMLNGPTKKNLVNPNERETKLNRKVILGRSKTNPARGFPILSVGKNPSYNIMMEKLM